jgi:hypothetical protein
MAQIGITSSLSTTFTVAQLNGVLTNTMQLDTSVTHNIQVRVVLPYAVDFRQPQRRCVVLRYAELHGVHPMLPHRLSVAPERPLDYRRRHADGWMTAGSAGYYRQVSK